MDSAPSGLFEQRQIDAFLRPDGRIEKFCDGPCFFTGVPNVERR